MDSSGFRTIGLGRALVVFLIVCCLIAFALGAGVMWIVGEVF